MTCIRNFVKTIEKVEHGIAETVAAAIDAASGRGTHAELGRVTKLPNGHLILEIPRGDNRPLRIVAEHEGDLIHGKPCSHDNSYNLNTDYKKEKEYNP